MHKREKEIFSVDGLKKLDQQVGDQQPTKKKKSRDFER